MVWRDPKLFHLFYLLQHAHICIFCCCWVELIYQTFLKASQQNCNNVFWQKKMISSLFLFVFERRKVEILLAGFYFKNNHTTSLWIMAQVSDDNCCKPQNAIMISHCQGDDTFVAFQPIGIFHFWRNEEFTFFKDAYSSSVFLDPCPLPSQVFSFGLESSFLMTLSGYSMFH